MIKRCAVLFMRTSALGRSRTFSQRDRMSAFPYQLLSLNWDGHSFLKRFANHEVTLRFTGIVPS